jgi:hypothetical protein
MNNVDKTPSAFFFRFADQRQGMDREMSQKPFPLRHRIKLIILLFFALTAILLLYHVTPWKPVNRLLGSASANFSLGISRTFYRDDTFRQKVHNLSYTGQDENMTRRNGTRRRLPQCIIIGVRKGGTRALLTYIDLHPSVKRAGKELHFFDRNYSLGLEYYRSLLPYSEPHELTIEKTPKYFVTPEAPERVHRMNNSIKLIVIFREPVERAVSDYLQVRRWEILHGEPLRDKFEDFAIDKVTGKVNYFWHAIRDSIYHKYLAAWQQYFPLKQILVLDSKDLRENPFPVLQKVELFLNLEPRITSEMFYFNKTKGFYCTNAPSGGCMGRSKGLPHPDVDPKVIEKLRTFFRPHNEVLYKLVGHDFKWP